jgi:hypothetical protein
MMVKRRTNSKLVPQQFFDEVLLSPLLWPGKTIRLERDSLVDFRQRPMSPHVSISELFHENSKLFPHMLSELAAKFLQVEVIRRDFVERRAVVVGAAGTVEFELGKRYRDLLTGVTRSIPSELFYAIDLRVVSGKLLAAYEPVLNTFQVVKELSSGDLEALKHAPYLLSPTDTAALGGPMLLLLGSFARNEILFGPRGYRRTLLEAGRVAEAVITNADSQRIKARTLYEFADRELDVVMDADGLEQGTVMIVELE